MTQEQWITTENGRLFVKRWEPLAPKDRAQAPIVLFHDSLGCVELWRDFPKQLATATGRTVIAYDRLGFGQSDPYPGSLPLSFVSDEASDSFAALRAQMELEQFMAFGHSIGGGMAIRCATVYPAQCQALVTESAQVFVEEQTLEGIRKAKQAFAKPGELDRLKKYHGDKAAWVLSAWIDSWLSEAFRHWSLEESLSLVRCPGCSRFMASRTSTARCAIPSISRP